MGNFFHKFKTAFFATLFCLAIYVGFGKVAGFIIHKIEILNPMVNKIEDFELSDLVFAYIHEKAAPESNIVIINCNNDDRNEIAKKIKQISAFKPKVIGIDIIFSNKEDSLNNADLINAINVNISKIVLANSFAKDDESRTMNLPFYQDLQFSNTSDGVYHTAILEKEKLFETKRDFIPYFKTSAEKTDTAFALKIVRLAYGVKTLEGIVSKPGENILINYRNAIESDSRYNVYEDVPKDSNLIKNKIVLLGGFDRESFADKHYTPLNLNIGRSLPDMNGIEYQAQIMSMIINQDYIHELTFKGFWIFISCFLCMFIFLRLKSYEHYYHFLLDFILIFILAPVSFFACSQLLESAKIKFEPSEFVVPIFFVGIILHLYTPFIEGLERLKKRKKHENTITSNQKT